MSKLKFRNNVNVDLIHIVENQLTSGAPVKNEKLEPIIKKSLLHLF